MPLGLPSSADGLSTKLRVVPLLPSVIRMDARWQKGVPKTWPAVGEYLREQTGHDFPVLSRLQHKRAIRAIGSTFRENLNQESTVLGLQTKVLAGAVFAEIISDSALAADIRGLAPNADRVPRRPGRRDRVRPRPGHAEPRS